ncbi:head-closure protein [Vibrio phage LP.2]|nr:head-closure protein [Vibrio phage LP.2]
MALDLSNVSDRLITKLSGDKDTTANYKVEYETGGSEDPNTGQWTPGTQESFDVDATETSLDNSLIDGVNIFSTDRMLLVSPKVSIPDNAWFVVRGLRLSIEAKPHIWNGGVLQLQRFVVRSS